jgi:hypothetical protein
MKKYVVVFRADPYQICILPEGANRTLTPNSYSTASEFNAALISLGIGPDDLGKLYDVMSKQGEVKQILEISDGAAAQFTVS